MTSGVRLLKTSYISCFFFLPVPIVKNREMNVSMVMAQSGKKV